MGWSCCSCGSFKFLEFEAKALQPLLQFAAGSSAAIVLAAAILTAMFVRRAQTVSMCESEQPPRL